MTVSGPCILFEPWNLGDALIAVATALQDPGRIAVACHSKWHVLIRLCVPEGVRLELIAVDLEYVNRGRRTGFAFGETKSIADPRPVLSIRGDPRDLLAAKRIFPRSKIRMTGWFSFLARRFRLLDFPVVRGWLPVRNRYRAWARLAGVPFEKVERFYEARRSDTRPEAPIVIHIGAQWRAKQYPWVERLKRKIEAAGRSVKVVAGPADPLPEGIPESVVLRLTNGELVREFKNGAFVLSNDSGPMHLAAILGLRTLVSVRTSNIAEWLPPGVTPIESERMPRGYRADPEYDTDRVLNGWPSPEEILTELFSNPVR